MSLYIYLFVLFITLVITLLNWGSLIKSDLQPLFWLIISTAFVESVGAFYILFYNKSHPWIYKIYVIVEYSLICFYFLRILKPLNITKVIKLTLTGPPVYIFLLIAFPEEFGYLNKYKFLFIAFLIVIWSAFYFKNLLDTSLELNLKKDPNFYINTGFLLFFGGSFFLMGLIFYVQERDMALARNLYSINHVLNIFYYSLLAYGFICHSKSMKS